MEKATEALVERQSALAEAEEEWLVKKRPVPNK